MKADIYKHVSTRTCHEIILGSSLDLKHEGTINLF